MISTNPGQTVRPLHEIASGGELSRIMLAIKSILADEEGIETLILMKLIPESADEQRRKFRKGLPASRKSDR